MTINEQILKRMRQFEVDASYRINMIGIPLQDEAVAVHDAKVISSLLHKENY